MLNNLSKQTFEERLTQLKWNRKNTLENIKGLENK